VLPVTKRRSKLNWKERLRRSRMHQRLKLQRNQKEQLRRKKLN